MTEGEAKTKWCPHVRMDIGAGIVANYYNATDAVTSIAWRWWYDPEINYDVEALRGKPPENGYCGLAGKP